MTMKELIDSFGQQLLKGVEVGENLNFTAPKNPIQNIVITGLGGSGMGGKIVAELLENELDVPVYLNNSYSLPNFVSKNTLVIASSFSGNTEETICALEFALERKAECAIISSGGRAIEIAKEEGLSYAQVPNVGPPRANIGLSIVQQLYLLKAYQLIDWDVKAAIKGAVAFLSSHKESIKTEAEKLASFLYKKQPIVYACHRFHGAAIRFKQQLNENAKMLAWTHVIPEMNHNELVGWAGGSKQHAPVFFETASDSERNHLRAALSKEIIKNYTEVYTVKAQGSSALTQTLYLIHLSDWCSQFLADKNQVDIFDIDVIEHLKSELAKH
jgi:glucose/mannose-6-phosphate isomerase